VVYHKEEFPIWIHGHKVVHLRVTSPEGGPFRLTRDTRVPVPSRGRPPLCITGSGPQVK
jgi:hypothetical protein